MKTMGVFPINHLGPPFAVVAYVPRDGRLLSISSPTRWVSAPGGKIEPGERPSSAVLRELMEETGLAGQGVRQVLRAVDDMGHDTTAYIVHVDAKAEPEAREPGTRVSWVTPEAMSRGYCPRFHRAALSSDRLEGGRGADSLRAPEEVGNGRGLL